jgi:hypothetical protein
MASIMHAVTLLADGHVVHVTELSVGADRKVP